MISNHNTYWGGISLEREKPLYMSVVNSSQFQCTRLSRSLWRRSRSQFPLHIKKRTCSKVVSNVFTLPSPECALPLNVGRCERFTPGRDSGVVQRKVQNTWIALLTAGGLVEPSSRQNEGYYTSNIIRYNMIKVEGVPTRGHKSLPEAQGWTQHQQHQQQQIINILAGGWVNHLIRLSTCGDGNLEGSLGWAILVANSHSLAYNTINIPIELLGRDLHFKVVSRNPGLNG